MSCVSNKNLIKMQMFDLRWKTCFISDENPVVFHLVFHWVSRFIHLTRIEVIYWLLTAWIINEFEELGKMVLTWKNVSHLEKWVTVGKIGHISKNGSHLEKWVTLGKMCYTWKHVSHLEKCVFLGGLHTWKNGSHLLNGSHLEKWVTLGKMFNTWKNVSHLVKWVTLGKMVYTLKSG